MYKNSYMKKLYFWIGGVFYVILGIVSLGFFYFLFTMSPLMEFPQPTGPYQVGLSKCLVQDTTRSDALNPAAKRLFLVDIFYPCIPLYKDRAFAYQPEKLEALQSLIAERVPWAPEFFKEGVLQGIESYASPDSYCSSQGAPYPVIIFLPGIAGEGLYNLYLEDLASHGYIVFAIEPPYDIWASVFPDGDVKKLHPDLKRAIDEGDRKAIYAYRKKAHEEWLKDIDVVLDVVKEFNRVPASNFYKRLDLSRIGFLGHSHGGAVVTDYCMKNDCKAGVNMDGWTKTANIIKPVPGPFLFLVNEGGMDELEELAKISGPSVQLKKIQGATHDAFSDKIALKDPLLKWYLGITTGDSEKVRENIQQSLISFFDRTLKALNSEQNGSE